MQTVDGFGFSLTGGSALHINNMSSGAKSSLLNELFGAQDGQLDISYLRVSIGSSDLDAAPFSYNDLPAGETDTDLSEFSLAPDQSHLIPVLQEILAINPDIKIMGSPWSAPVWMKTNNSTIGGELNPDYYAVYAQYFVKYVQGMAALGIPIDAITIQNEPENPHNNPSMLMSATQQADFIKNHLGPAFQANSISTKIILFDHNLDHPNYPISILEDTDAYPFIDGSAFHLYAGQISNMNQVHNAFPEKNLYFTEQWMQAPGNFPEDFKFHTRELIIGAMRNWSRNVLEWNLASDANWEPHTDGGCTECLGGLTISGDNVERNPAYYVVAQVSQFVPAGSVRIDSNTSNELPNVAFKTPDNQIVVVVLNNTDVGQSFNISVGETPVSTVLPANSAGTFVWQL